MTVEQNAKFADQFAAQLASDIRAEMMVKGLTLNGLAAAMGVSLQTASARRAGEIPYNVEQLAKVAVWLGTTPHALVKRAERADSWSVEIAERLSDIEDAPASANEFGELLELVDAKSVARRAGQKHAERVLRLAFEQRVAEVFPNLAGDVLDNVSEIEEGPGDLVRKLLHITSNLVEISHRLDQGLLGDALGRHDSPSGDGAPAEPTDHGDAS